MSYEVPTVALLKTRYPEFLSVDDARVEMFIMGACRFVDEAWRELDYQSAIMALTAHFMALEGEPARSDNVHAGSVDPLAVGRNVRRRKVGDVETEFEQSNSGPSSGNTFVAHDYNATPYGKHYRRLMQLNVFPAAVV